MRKIVVLGSTNTDMVVAGRRIPSPGETISGGTFMMNPGGKGANQAVAVARLAKGSPALRSLGVGGCTFIAKVGADLFGRETAVRMRKDGIDAKLIVDRKEPSGTALILVAPNGQNVISVALGANGTLSPKDIAKCRRDIEGAAALLLQLETPMKTVMTAAKWAHAKGVPVVLNPAPAAKLPRGLYRCLDWITPNETEAELLTGVKVTDAKSAQRAVDVFLRRGVGHVAITMGAKGVYCGDCRRLYPARKVRAVDCVAAGDTFNGAFVVALTEGKGCGEAIGFAQKAAAISVMRRGAQSSVPFRAEVEACGK